MIITELRAKNFKSFTPEGIEYRVQRGLNTIVGENNVGKSNIIKILSELIMLLKDMHGFIGTDAFQGNIDNPVELDFHALLDEEDIVFLMRKFNVPLEYRDDFGQIFGKDLGIQFTFSRYDGGKITIQFGKMTIVDNRGTYDKTSIGQSYREHNWSGLVNHASRKKVSLLASVEALLSEQSDSPNMIDFGSNPKSQNFFYDLLLEKIIIFPEFRSRPSSEVKTGIFLSPSGGELASVLFNLKTSEKKKRKRFDKIQEYFTQIFPNLKLDVMQGHTIVVEKSDGTEVEQNSIGAGIIEVINLLTHLIGTEKHVFVLDEPELHLHPHAKRSISDLIQNASESNQIVCVTHSTNFIRMDSINNVTCVRDKSGHSELASLPENYFALDEIKKLKRITEPRQKEFLFSRAVLIVEGDTEVGAIPIFAKKHDKDLDIHNISVIGVDSHYFALFVKLFRGFRIPYLVMLDKDTLGNIEVSITVNSQNVSTSSLIRQLDGLGDLTSEDKMLIKSCVCEIVQDGDSATYSDDAVKKLKNVIMKHKFIRLLDSDFEGLFDAPTYRKIVKDAKKDFSGSKVLQGRYIADNIPRTPMVLKEVIRQIVDLSMLDSQVKRT